MRALAVIFLLSFVVESAFAQTPPAGSGVSQMPAPVRLTFGIISNNRAFIRSAFAEDASGSILNATLADAPAETRTGPDAIADLIGTLPSLTGRIDNGRCAPGEPGKFTCEYEVGRSDRRLMALIDLRDGLITSIILAVTPGEER